MKIIGIIPSRFESTRLPGKPLLDINGKTMIERVYNQCKQAKKLDEVIVATDSEQIFNEVVRFGGKAIMTSKAHQSGTDRCAEVMQSLYHKFDFVINIQGDEPFIQPEQIDILASNLNQNIQIATLIKKIDNLEDLLDENKPKVIFRKDNNEAIYFSRHAIPFVRGIAKEQWLFQHTFYKHIGIYAYKTDVLIQISKLTPSLLEKSESLEQLRWIENGFQINTQITELETFGIDTQKDLEIARKIGKD